MENWLTMTVSFRTVTIPAATPTLVAAASGDRRRLSLCNIGVNRATMGDSNVVADAGWPLAAAPVAGGQGGGYEWSSAGGTPSSAIYVVSTLGTTIAVMES